MILRRPDPPLADEAVRLRLWQEDDVDALTALIAGDPTLPQWTMIPPDYTRQDARTFIRNAPDLWRDSDAAVFCIASTDGADQILGGIDLRLLANGIGHIGYWVAEPHRGRGVASRALRLIARWGLSDLELGRVELQVIVGNRGSERVAEKAGFRFEGLLRSSIVQQGQRRDTLMYSLLPADLASPDGGR